MDSLRYSTSLIDEDDIAAVVRALRSDWLTQGPILERFEEELAAYTGARYAIAVSSGTAALHLAFTALAHSIGPELVLTSPLSFVATANTALMAGHEIGFVDVDRETGNMVAPQRRAKVLAPVHYAGRACDLEPFQGATIIEDACHAIGAMDYDGCSKIGACAHSLAACFSFHAVKPMTTGEGGAVTTNDQGFADEMRRLRSHGRDENGRMVELGFNYRMTELQAALGLSQLGRLDEMRARRVHLVCEYRALLPEYGMMLGDGTDAWHLYPIRIKGRRNDVKAKLNAQGIGAQIHYPCIHMQPYYRHRFGFREGICPEAEAWAAEELSLPLHAKMTDVDVRRVVETLRVALKGSSWDEANHALGRV